jgi:hypothetical protein
MLRRLQRESQLGSNAQGSVNFSQRTKIDLVLQFGAINPVFMNVMHLLHPQFCRNFSEESLSSSLFGCD